MSFNPFGKQIDDIETNDLKKLVDLRVSEGYFVECKSEFPEQRKTARAIASLANTDGGWYVVGVEADKQQGNTITRISGFDKSTCPDPVAKVRTAVSAHVSPAPVFVSRELTLDDGRAVVVVFVPSDQDTPFVTSDGRVYRRVGDSSEPVPATDRYTLDRLIDGRRRQRERRERFCRDERTFSQAEHQGRVMVFLWPYPVEVNYRTWMCESEGARRLLDLSRKPLDLRLEGYAQPMASLAVPFDAANVTARSVVLRQETQSRAPFNGTAVEFFQDGRARFYVPFPSTALESGSGFVGIKSPICRRALEERWLRDGETRRLTHPFDAGALLLALASLCSFYLAWHGPFLQGSEVLWALRLQDSWRWWPFWDSDEWGHHVSEFGLPILRSSEYRHPEGGMLNLSDKEIPSLWAKICVQGGMAVGVPGDLVVDAMAHGTASVGPTPT